MAIDWLPAAVRDPRGRALNWTEKTDPKGCIHTTETSGWPGYAGWTVHPHATILPKAGVGVTVHQNIPFSRASFSLRNLPGGVATNTDFVFQFELIGTAEQGGPGYFWPNADDAVLKDLYRKLIQPLSAAYGIPLRARPFQSYPASYGARGKTNTVRLSGSEFDNYSGWLGHQHVPENVHGDPGAFPWDRMMKLVAPKPVEDIVASKSELRAELIDLIQKERLVENLVLDGGAVQGRNWTLPEVLAADDRKLDLIRREQATQAEAQKSQATALESLMRAVSALTTKVDGLAKAVTALKPPPPTVPASRPPTS